MHSARLRLLSINPWGQTIKMYDKYQIVLRVETVANDVSFFKHHRKVEHRDGRSQHCSGAFASTV
jgi:hypothetical protein